MAGRSQDGAERCAGGEACTQTGGGETTTTCVTLEGGRTWTRGTTRGVVSGGRAGLTRLGEIRKLGVRVMRLETEVRARPPKLPPLRPACPNG